MKLVLFAVLLLLPVIGIAGEGLRTVCANGLEVPAQQGCCSWHGGVCGCYGIRVVCCDNTLSPSCTCRGGADRVLGRGAF